MARPSPAPTIDPKALADAIAKLSPDEAQVFLSHMDGALKKRKVQLWGYFCGALAWTVMMAFALYWYGSAPTGTFISWVFLLPFAVLGGVLWIFGWLADKVAAAYQQAGYSPR